MELFHDDEVQRLLVNDHKLTESSRVREFNVVGENEATHESEEMGFTPIS
jgi:hypothetical protein